MMQEAEDVQWRGVGERSGCSGRRRTNRANRQKTLEINPQAVLLFCVLCVADEGTQGRKTLIKVTTLTKKENNSRSTTTREKQGPN